MAKKKLRLLKHVPAMIGICEGCLAQFKPVFRGPMVAQAEFRVCFAAHKCTANETIPKEREEALA